MEYKIKARMTVDCEITVQADNIDDAKLEAYRESRNFVSLHVGSRTNMTIDEWSISDTEIQSAVEVSKPQIEMTPMLKQFYDLKHKRPDALLLFRCGDFYETYSNDAEEAAKILGITLTRSTKQKDKDRKNLAMAGFPYHALDTYLPKLIRAGKRVSICDQIEDPRQKKLAKRGISEMVSPGIDMKK